MIKDIQKTLMEDIKNVSWIDETTKLSAIEKVYYFITSYLKFKIYDIMIYIYIYIYI